MSATTTTAKGSTSSTFITSQPAPDKPRSNEEIARLVQQRVRERDSWLVDGEPPERIAGLADFGNFFLEVFPKYALHKDPPQDFLDEHFPLKPIEDWNHLQNPPVDKIQLTWLGHASVLMQVQGCNVVTDPVFSQRCAPTQWSGPKRVRQPPCGVRDLFTKLMVDVVLISHNHYDHLDYDTVREIHRHSPATAFVVPLGIREWFHKNVSSNTIVYELDWNEHVDYSYSTDNGRQTLRIISVPMRHWGSRYGIDRDTTLWCGYSLATQSARQMPKRILFPGDTAWFDDMDKLVGEPYGPHDVAAIPIGAYEPRNFMKHNHVNVEEAVRMKDALHAKAAVPIHWGTFSLTVEPFLEPKEVLEELMKQRDDTGSFAPWLIGESRVF
jgi:N-acyl-phosphatidylethanolamine-hydrolysing phospholipase D